MNDAAGASSTPRAKLVLPASRFNLLPRRLQPTLYQKTHSQLRLFDILHEHYRHSCYPGNSSLSKLSQWFAWNSTDGDLSRALSCSLILPHLRIKRTRKIDAKR